MKTNHIILLASIATLSITSGCSSNKPKVDNAQYWQRVKASETTYINGPKAQQLLNRDIARCVTELKELERVRQIKEGIPGDSIDNKTDEEKRLANIDAYDRDGYLYAEHKDYQDFESCMAHSGWERTKTLSYEAEHRGKKNFFLNHIDFKLGGEPEDPIEKGEKQTLPRSDLNE